MPDAALPAPPPTPPTDVSTSAALEKRRGFFSQLGPGVISGAADDDPSGIATYSIAGAQFGSSLYWTALLTWPLMAAVQFMCARIGMVTGRGLMGALRRQVPRPVLATACVLLFCANAINIGADLSGMADAAELLSGVNSHLFVVAFAGVITWATIQFRYAVIANVLKWLALVLFAYVFAAVRMKPDWTDVARAVSVPRLPESQAQWQMLVAILGTTISPYLFFWQASQEVEEEKALGRTRVKQREGASPFELKQRAVDVGIGTLFSNVAMLFIMLTCALALHGRGNLRLETSRDVAEALTPFAGRYSALLYTIGVIGTGALAIPTLAGSAAYAFAETFGWRQGIDEKLRRARSFYGVLALSMLCGMLLDFTNVRPVRALYLSALLNGFLAPFLLVGILYVASNKRLMHRQCSGKFARAVVGVTIVAMFAASVLMLI
jgi:NRAMP (natural resistance-associated macrophage protein)-like metal ion transporter